MAEMDGYGFGRVRIDGREETRDVIVLPGRVVRGWWRREGHRLVLGDLDEVLDELPDRLLVGTGAYRRMRPDPGMLEALRDRGSMSRCCRPRRLCGATRSWICGRRWRRCI